MLALCGVSGAVRQASRRCGRGSSGQARSLCSSVMRAVPASIPRPDYAVDGVPKAGVHMSSIEIKSPQQVLAMREACRAAREVLDEAGKAIRPNITTLEIDRVVHEACLRRGVYPSPLNYFGFPKSCCTSINHVVCHGIPDGNTVLKDGDIVNVDVSVFKGGYHGDCSETFCVGAVDEASKRLVKATHCALELAIAACGPGQRYSAIGKEIERFIAPFGFSIVSAFCGHGIGRGFHMLPHVLHCNNSEPAVMQPGHTFTIEPMINEGVEQHKLLEDEWTAVTLDGKRSAQFEHTLLVTNHGVEVLTQKTDSSPRYWWEEPNSVC